MQKNPSSEQFGKRYFWWIVDFPQYYTNFPENFPSRRIWTKFITWPINTHIYTCKWTYVFYESVLVKRESLSCNDSCMCSKTLLCFVIFLLWYFLRWEFHLRGYINGEACTSNMWPELLLFQRSKLTLHTHTHIYYYILIL